MIGKFSVVLKKKKKRDIQEKDSQELHPRTFQVYRAPNPRLPK